MTSLAQVSGPIYQTITGGHIALSGLSEAEYDFLDIVAKKYSPKQDWTRFAAWWNAKFNVSGLPMKSVVYRICQDLEVRLGINQGKVAPPDYRDYLSELIDAQFSSRQDFCRATGVDPGQLSRVLASRDNLSIKVLLQVLEVLHARLVIQTKQDSPAQTSIDRAIDGIAESLRVRAMQAGVASADCAERLNPVGSDIGIAMVDR
jgi:transcriptional regulator with XRE-family HTH domain